MDNITSVLVNIDQGMTATEKQQARKNMDAQVHTVTAANSKMTLTENDTSAVLTLPTSILDIKYPLTFTTTATETKLGMNTSTFMTKAQYDTLQDNLTAQLPISLAADGTLSKPDTKYTADETSGVNLSGTVFSLKTASSSQRGGVQLGDGLGINDSGSLTTTITAKTVTSGTESVKANLINSPYFYNIVPTITAKTDTYEVNVGVTVNQSTGRSKEYEHAPLVEVGSDFSGGDDLSVKVTASRCTVGVNAASGSQFMYIKNGVPTAATGSAGSDKGKIMYMSNGNLVSSTATVGSYRRPVYFSPTEGIKAWSDQIGNLGTGIAAVDGTYDKRPNPFYYGNATSSKVRNYTFYKTSGITKGSTDDGMFSLQSVMDAMAAGASTFRFNYMYTSDWSGDNRKNDEIIPVPIRSMVPGVIYTFSYNFGYTRDYETNDHGTFDAEHFFGLGFYDSWPQGARGDATAYYYGFLTGTCLGAQINMHSPFYVQENTNSLTHNEKLIIPCIQGVDRSGSKPTIEYPQNFPYNYGTKLRAPSVVVQHKDRDWMYWRILVGNGCSSSTDNYAYDTRVGPMNSISFMRGANMDDIPTIFAISYT